MSLVQLLHVRRVIAVAIIGTLACSLPLRAQVLDQVPANSMAVLKINNLQRVSDKLAKLANDWGVDQIQPLSKDPLAAFLQGTHMMKGVDKSGDMAICATFSGDKEPQVMGLVPVSDFKAFVSNFEPAGPQNAEIREVKDPDTQDGKMYIAERGKYAAIGNDRDMVATKAIGIKLPAGAMRDSQQRDAIVFINIPTLRDSFLPHVKQSRQMLIDSLTTGLADDEHAKPYVGVAKVAANEALDFAENFLDECQGATLSLNIAEQGISFGSIYEFPAGSKIGKTVAQFKNSDRPLLAGLPDRKYFAFVGMAWDADAMKNLTADILDPITKALASAGDDGKKIAKLLESAKTLAGAVTQITGGYPAPQAMGNGEGIVQQVSIVQGDAKTIHEAEKSLLQGVSELMALMPKEAAKTQFTINPQTRTVDGVKLDSFTMTMSIDNNNPQAAAIQPILSMIYGANGMGGSMGEVNAKTFIMIQGGNEKLLTDTIASAREQTDTISNLKGVKMVSSAFSMKKRSIEEYIALDNVVNTALKVGDMWGFNMKVKLPGDLPPVGFAAGTEGSSIRGEVFVPSQTVQSLISAGLQVMQQMKPNNNGKL